MKFLKWSLIGVGFIAITVLLTQHFFRDAIAIKKINSSIKMEGITLRQHKDDATKLLGYGKRIPSKSYGYVLQYDDLDLQIYYEDGRVTGIITTNPSHSLYAIHVGSTAKEAKSILEEHDFTLLSDTQVNDRNNILSYSIANGNIIVSYEAAGEYVSKLIVQYVNPRNKNKTA